MISSFLGFNFSGFARKHFGDSIHLWGQPLVCAILKEILQGNQVCSSNGLISLSHYAQRICTVIWTYKTSNLYPASCGYISWWQFVGDWRLLMSKFIQLSNKLQAFKIHVTHLLFLELFCDHLAWCSLCFECMQIKLKHNTVRFSFACNLMMQIVLQNVRKLQTSTLQKRFACIQWIPSGKQNIDPNFPALKQLEFWKHFCKNHFN